MQKLQQRGLGSVELLEEAVHLLRSAPFSLFAGYFVGTLPFVLGFLYFWADMSRSPFASRHLLEASAAMVLLYIWMKCWQSQFAIGLLTVLSGSPPRKFDSSEILQLVITQTILHATAFVMLPLAMLVVLPFAPAYAFYHNVSLIGDGKDRELLKVVRKAWKLATLWGWQNHNLIFIVMLLAIVVFLNWATLLFLLPELVRMLLGIETPFTLGGLTLLNTTFWAVAAALTYLALNPLVHAAYVLRCFLGESLQSGADLQAELKSVSLQANDSLRSA